jgi:hypothetical protein
LSAADDAWPLLLRLVSSTPASALAVAKQRRPRVSAQAFAKELREGRCGTALSLSGG